MRERVRVGEGSENDGRDMGMFISNIMRLKAHFGCHIMIIHHTGKDRAKGARGHLLIGSLMVTKALSIDQIQL